METPIVRTPKRNLRRFSFPRGFDEKPVRPHGQFAATSGTGFGNKEELMLIEEIIEQKTGALRANDIARILDLSKKQIYKMAANGEIPSLKIANSVRFDPHDFAAWLRTRSSAPEIEPNARVSARQSRSQPHHRPNRQI
jgi:excisionase family DNA binding protein